MYRWHSPYEWDLPARPSGRKRPPLPDERRSPTLRRRELGTLLRALRTQQGMTVEQVAEHLLCSPSKVSRMETGQRGATQRDVRDLCELYGVTDPGERDRMMRLAREAREQGWWQPYDLPYQTYVGLEVEAVRISQFQAGYVPGLLQTADYAREVIRTGPDEYGPEQVEQYVEARIRRQELLTKENAPAVHIVMDESIIRRPVGGSAVMLRQLEHIVRMSALPHVSIQVISWSMGAHLAMESDFRILDLPEPSGPVVYVEGLIGYVYLERDDDIERFRTYFSRLKAIAMNSKDSMAFIRREARAHRLGA